VILWPETGDPDWPAYAKENGWTELGLDAVALIRCGEDFRSGEQAVATEAAWRAYQIANAANDRNGSYNVASINVTREGMEYQWDYRFGDSPDVVFPRVERLAPDGSPLFLFPGPWVVD
jgi:hypothetical protein